MKPTAEQKDQRLRRTLQYIIQFTQDNSYPPMLREIQAGVGLKSKSTVADRLAELEARGYLERQHDTPRAMRITARGRQWALAHATDQETHP
jgi:repressor LexA